MRHPYNLYLVFVGVGALNIAGVTLLFFCKKR